MGSYLNIDWTQGAGCIPITLKDSDGQTFNPDLQGADYKDDTAFLMLPLCKPLKGDWKSKFTQDGPYAITRMGDLFSFSSIRPGARHQAVT